MQRCGELCLDGNSTFFSISEASSSTKVYRALLAVTLKDNKSAIDFYYKLGGNVIQEQMIQFDQKFYPALIFLFNIAEQRKILVLCL